MAEEPSKAFWAAVGGMCAVITTVIAAVQLAQADDGPPPPTPSSAENPVDPPGQEDPPDDPPDDPPAAILDLSLTPGQEGGAAAGFGGPLAYQVTSGGPVDASYLDDPSCRGHATAAASLRFQWDGNGGLLRFFFVGDGDTTLLVNANDGSWHCADDSFGLNPMVEFPSASDGRYDVWVGSYSGTPVGGQLSVTELNSVTPAG